MSIQAVEPPVARRAGRRLLWELALVAALLVVMLTRFSSAKEFARLLLGARLGWILAGLVFQLGTYLATAAVWTTVLRPQGLCLRATPLLTLAVERQSIDHLLPSFGLSGRVVVLRGLGRVGVNRSLAAGAVLADLLSFYLAQGLLLAPVLLLLRKRHELPALVKWLSLGFGFLVAALPVVLLWVTDPRAHVPRLLLRLRPVREVVSTLHEVPRGMLRSFKSLAPCVALQASVFLLDAATLGAMLAAVGQPLRPAVALTSLVVAEVAGTVGLLPGGIGPYEAAAVAMLTVQGTPLSAALAATVLFRGMALWLPLGPGAWFARRSLAGK